METDNGKLVLERGLYGPIRWECPDCEGSGENSGTCERCDGSGEITVESEREIAHRERVEDA